MVLVAAASVALAAAVTAAAGIRTRRGILVGYRWFLGPDTDSDILDCLVLVHSVGIRLDRLGSYYTHLGLGHLGTVRLDRVLHLGRRCRCPDRLGYSRVRHRYLG